MDAGTASAAALEAAILADPEARDPYLVYADWLSERGDPRGRLIELHARGADADAQAWLAQHRPALLGGLDPADPLAPVTLTWHLGFWRGARLYSRAPLSRPQTRAAYRSLVERVAALLVSPSARFLRTFAVHEVSAPPFEIYEEVVRTLVRHGSPALRDLDVHLWYNPPWPSRVADLSMLWDAFPRLQRLSLRGDHVDLGLARAGGLRELDLVVVPHPRDPGALAVLRELGAAHWPHLERLILRVSIERGGDVDLDVLAPILEARHTPALRDLRLVATGWPPGRVERLARSPLCAQLERLHLTLDFGDRDRPELLRHAAAFQHLRQLVLDGPDFDAEERRGLDGLAAEVRFGPLDDD